MLQLDPTSEESFLQLARSGQVDDSGLIPEFFVMKKLMGYKSELAGKPVYEDREYLRIYIKGQDKQVTVQEVTQEIKRRFPIAYAVFKNQLAAPKVGTPIELLPNMGPSQAHQLKGLSLHTIEDLARISDENTLSAIGGGARELVNRCKAWLEVRAPKEVELEAELAEERAAREKDKAAFQAQLDALKAQMPPAPKARKKKARA